MPLTQCGKDCKYILNAKYFVHTKLTFEINILYSRTLEKASVNPNELAAVEKTNAPIEVKEEEKVVEEGEDE